MHKWALRGRQKFQIIITCRGSKIEKCIRPLARQAGAYIIDYNRMEISQATELSRCENGDISINRTLGA